MGRPANPYAPRPIEVSSAAGRPVEVGGRQVESIREQWLVEDRWWSGAPMRRHYMELVLTGGRRSVVFCDLETNLWFAQR
jgi:hypothetical protein